MVTDSYSGHVPREKEREQTASYQQHAALGKKNIAAKDVGKRGGGTEVWRRLTDWTLSCSTSIWGAEIKRNQTAGLTRDDPIQ